MITAQPQINRDASTPIRKGQQTHERGMKYELKAVWQQ
jgi:hypothetical protein